MAAYVDQLVLFDKTNAKYILPDESDTLELNLNGLTLNSNTTIGGDLTVNRNHYNRSFRDCSY